MHRQLPGWRSLIKSIVGRVYANTVKSKWAFPWLVTPLRTLWIWNQYFVPDILFLRVWATFNLTCCVFNAEFMLFFFLWKRGRSFISRWVDWQICSKEKMDNIRCGQRLLWSRLTQTLIKPLEIWRDCGSYSCERKKKEKGKEMS